MNKPVVFITGANKGIGFEIARQLGMKGFFVLLSARNQERGQAAWSDLSNQGVEGAFVQMDISQPESIGEAVRKTQSLVSRIDVLINNAGILLDEFTSLLEIKPEDSLATLQTNALGPLWVVQSFLPLLDKGSRIVMMSSMSGAYCKDFSTWSPVYAVSKVTMNAITRQLAPVLAKREVRINAMCPGWVRTDMGGAGAGRSVEKGAETAVWLATEAPDFLHGKFLRDKSEISW